MSEQPIVFIAGATGFTGRAIAHQDVSEHGVDVRLQVRPGSPRADKLASDPRICEVSWADPEGLEQCMKGANAVMQLIGTVRAQFDAQTNYETIDYQSTVQLLQAAKRSGVQHFILLSSMGAQTGWGSYLSWKKKTEELVRASGIPFTIVRPSYLAGDAEFTDRMRLEATSAFLRGLSDTFMVGGLAADVRPIPIQILARVMLHLVHAGPQKRALSGRHLWQIAREQKLYAFIR